MANIRCEDVMSRSPRTCTSNDTLLDAIRLMKEIDVGFVPVCDKTDNRLVGVLTDRDIAMSLVRDRKPSDMRVNEVMSRDPITCKPNDDIMLCARAMEEYQLRRVPVVDDNFTLLGVIATADLARRAPIRKDLEMELPSIIESVSAPPSGR